MACLTTVAASSMTLGGMLKHLALVEDSWFCQWLLGRAGGPVGHGGLGRRPRLGLAFGRGGHARAAPDAVAGRRGRSRSAVTEALADGGMGRLARRTWPDGRSPSLRWIVCHMIEETPGTTDTPISSGSRSTGRPASSRRPYSHAGLDRALGGKGIIGGVTPDPTRQLLTIGDFAHQTRLTPKALRIYDEIGLLWPADADRPAGTAATEPVRSASPGS